MINKLQAILWTAALLIPAAHAQFLQQGNKLVGNDAIGSPSEGSSVAISADGNTSIVGGYYDNSGAGGATVYVRANGIWTQQGPKLVGSDSSNRALQGISIAISADGNTALVGGPGDGAGWVYTRTNNVWTQQGPKLSGNPALGRTVSLSADGNTALVGGPGTVNIYTRASGVWTLNATLPTGTGAVGDSSQGWAAALSGDGNTAIVGGNSDNFYVGAAWIFTRTSNGWVQQGPKLTGSDYVGTSAQGLSVALSADGSTAVLGGEGDNNGVGAAWIYTRANGVWTQQGSKLVGSGALGKANQGHAVSISADGNTIVSGGRSDNQSIGAAWAFNRSNNVWTQLGNKMVGTGFVGSPPLSAPSQGDSVALSGDGHTAIVGGSNDQPTGAAWVFVSAAVHFSITVPASVTAGVPFQFTVTALNPDNSVATGYNGMVHFSSTDPQAVVPADSPLASGAGTFTATLKTFLGNPILTAIDAANQTISGSSPPIAVAPGPTSRFTITATPLAVNPGDTFSFIVSAFDQYGNFAPANTAHIRFTSTDPAATLPPESVITGVRTLAAIFRTAGNQTITAIDTSNSSITGTSNLIAVSSTTTIDLALSKPATQSSTYAPNSSAFLAVDGNTDGNYFHGSVTATQVEFNPWWQVDLGSSSTVNSVVVWNRTDCCGSRLNNYWVFVSDTPFNSNDTPANLQNRAATFASHQTVAPDPYTTVTVGAHGRYVRVQLDASGPTGPLSANVLSLAEVQVMGVPGASTAVSLAQGKSATQSSTFPGYPSAAASSAVDANTDGSFFNGSVTSTNLDVNPWWQVDLGSNATVNSVFIWNRTDCCGTRLNDYWVFVSNSPFSDTDTPATLQNRAGVFAVHQPTAPDPSALIAIGGTTGFVGRYVRVQLNGNGYLSLAEVQVFGIGGAPDTNVAVNKAATQSSTLPGYPNAGASAAVDGNTNGNFFTSPVTATDLNTNAWWQVDLGSSTVINSVVVWNRTDCCGTRLNNFWVFVSDTPFLASDTPTTLQNRAGTFFSHRTTAPAPSTFVQVAGQGRYVRIQLDGTDYLSLAEVQVFGH